MENLVPMFQAFLGLGPTVILPVFIFIIGLIFRCGPAKSFHSGLTIGVGFVGINLVVALLCDNLGPAAQAMIKNFGIQLNAIDIGWPGSASMAWASPIAAFVLPLALVVNIIMLFTKTTKTMDVDIWNYWHFTFCGACVYALTGSFWQAIVAAIIFEIVVLKIADWTAPYMEKYFDLPGVSVPTGSTCSYAPLGIPLIWLIQKIPVIKNLKADPDSIQKRFGIFGEPIFMGLFLGAVLGVLAGYNAGEVAKVGMAMAGKMDNADYRVYTMVGNGESEEGQVWEASMFAGFRKLDNLVVIVDNNNLQIDGAIDEVCSPYPFDKKFEAFNFHVIKINGHDFDEIRSALKEARETKGMPTAIIMNTVKGKGVSFMENQVSWHGSAPNEEQYNIAMEELEKAGEALCQK